MDQVWNLLAELPLGSEPTDEAAWQHVADVLSQFEPGSANLERIRMAVAATVRKVLRNTAGETVCVQIYVSGPKRADLEQRQSWGFFVVEKPAVHDESLTYVELFLFAEGEMSGARR